MVAADVEPVGGEHDLKRTALPHQLQGELGRHGGSVIDRNVHLLVQGALATLYEDAEHPRSDASERAHPERFEVAGPVRADRGIGADHQRGPRARGAACAAPPVD